MIRNCFTARLTVYIASSMRVALYNYAGVAGLSSVLATTKQQGDEFFQVSPIMLTRDYLNSQETIYVSMPGLEEREFIYGCRLENILPLRICEDFQYSLDSIKEPPILSAPDLQMTLMMAQRTRLHFLDYSDIIFYVRRISHFWKAFLVYFGIDLCISSVVPHSFADYLLCCVSTYSNIPFLSQLPGGMSTHAFIYSHLESRCIKNKTYRSDISSDSNAREDFTSLLLATSNPKNIRIPHAGGKAFKANRMYTQNKQFLLNYVPEFFSPLSYLKSLAEQYDKISIDPREHDFGYFNSPRFHVYFMHYQPEATTMPMAKQFACQKYTVSYIRSLINPGDILLVKEHPQQFSRSSIAFSSEGHLKAFHGFRKPEDYCFISSLNNTYLINRFLSIFDIACLRPCVWISYGSVCLQSSILGLQTKFLDTMNPYKMIEHVTAYCELSVIDDRIEAIYDSLKEYLFPISRADHDTLVPANLCSVRINNIIHSHMHDTIII
jgi:hypothetical protein